MFFLLHKHTLRGIRPAPHARRCTDVCFGLYVPRLETIELQIARVPGIYTLQPDAHELSSRNRFERGPRRVRQAGASDVANPAAAAKKGGLGAPTPSADPNV